MHMTKSVISFIWIIVIVSLLSPILTFVLATYAHTSGPSEWLPLTYTGLAHGWLWQPLTYMFLHSPTIGITLNFLISLTFYMLILWFAGTPVEQRFGARPFTLFFLGAGLFAGLISAAALLLFKSSSIVIGSSPALYALLIVWVMINPTLELYFLFFVRLRAKVLVAIFLAIALLINLSHGAFIPFLADACGIIWGFAMGRLVWKLDNPYPLNLELPKRKKGNGKIIDISVFQESDDDFMNRMLDKIARKGENSLTKRERDRMDSISRKK